MFRIVSCLALIAASFHVCRAQDAPLQPSSDEKPGGTIDFIAFSPKGDLLATCSFPGQVHVWDAATCKRKLTLAPEVADGDVSLGGVAFSGDGSRVASVQRGPGRQRAVLIWDTENGTLLKTLHSASHRGTDIFCDLGFTPNGKAIWAVDGSNVFQWDVSTGRVSQYEVDGMLHGRLRFTRDSGALVVVGLPPFTLLDPRTGRRYFQTKDPLLRWGDVLPDGKRYVGITVAGELVLGQVAGGQVQKRFTPLHGGAGWAKVFDGDNLLLFTTTGHVERWNLGEVRCTGTLSQPLAVGNYFTDVTLKYGRPQPSMFTDFHPRPLAVSTKGSRLAVVAGRQFAVLPLDWQEP